MSLMMQVGNVKWIHVHSTEKSQINNILKEYDFHEIIEEDLMANHTQEKIDVYDNYIFLVLHFPKYNNESKRYLLNEFDIILGKNFIITFTKYKTNHIDKIRQEYQKEISSSEVDEKYKFTPYYILYKIIDVMYNKTMKMLYQSNTDLVNIEESFFTSKKLNQDFLGKMMIKRRNYVVLKHAFLPHEEILKEMQELLPKLYEEELDVYFEDLAFALDRIQSNIIVLNETVEALTETYNGMLIIQTNSIITMLTIFTAIMGILTLISGIYGMNIDIPYRDGIGFFWFIIGIMIFIAFTMLIIFKKKGWI